MSTSSESAPTLESLRREIDAIDGEIQALLELRARVVGQIGEAKKTAENSTPSGAMRPGREAIILRRLAERHKGQLPVEMLAGLWRGIISAFLRLQYPFTVYVATSQNSVFDLARVHFGPSTPLEAADLAKVIARVGSDEYAVGVLPVPDGTQDNWWAILNTAEAGKPQVVALLPFLSPHKPGNRAYILARTTHEETGDDITLIRLKDGSADLVKHLAQTARAEIVATRPNAGKLDALLAAPGYLDLSSRAFAGLKAEAAKAGALLDIIGGYAAPLRLKDETHS
jgi:chorismate mutase/prephenate dehydratase